jgi:hypothetical protein
MRAVANDSFFMADPSGDLAAPYEEQVERQSE